VQQHVTIKADPGDMSVVRIEKSQVGQTPVHRIQLQGGGKA
jgi:hypothetical protein